MKDKPITLRDIWAALKIGRTQVYHPEDLRGHIAGQGLLDGVAADNLNEILDYEDTGDQLKQSNQDETTN